MGALKDVAVRSLPGIVGTLIGHLGTRAVDAITQPHDSREIFEDYRRIVENSNLPRTAAEATMLYQGVQPAQQPVAMQPQMPAPEQPYNASGRNDMAVMNQQIDNAIGSLRSAKTHTKCSLCRATLQSLEKEIEEKTAFIKQSTAMWEAMQDLKGQGKIPAEAKWSELTEDQKAKVKAHASGKR